MRAQNILKTLAFGAVLTFAGHGGTSVSAAPEKLSAAPSGTGSRPLLDPSASVVSLKQKVFRHVAEKTQKPGQTISAMPWMKGFGWAATQYAKAPNDAARYLLVGQHLKLANECLQSGDEDRAFQGVALVCTAVQCCLVRLKDEPLAVDICDAYLVPQWQWANRTPPVYPGPEEVLQTMIQTYQAGKVPDKAIEACRILVVSAKSSNVADVARLNMAQMLATQKRWKEAIDCVKEISPTGSVSGARKLLPEYEKQLKTQTAGPVPAQKK